MPTVQVGFSSGFPLGGGFPTPMWCSAWIEYHQSKINGDLRCSAYFEYRWSKTWQLALREILFSAEIQILPEQLSQEHPPPKNSTVELHMRSLILLRCPPE
jgi:hypothetical protein